MYNETSEAKGHPMRAYPEGVDIGVQQKSSPIMTEYSDLQGQLAKLKEQIFQLSDRLAPVLGPERSEAVGNGESLPKASVCSLATSLQSDIAEVKAMQRSVSNMLMRIEL